MLLGAALARLSFVLSHTDLVCGSTVPVLGVGHRLCMHKRAPLHVMAALLPCGTRSVRDEAS